VPLTTTQAATIAADTTFIARVRIAFYFVAREKMGPKVNGETDEDVNNRRQEARSVLMAEQTQFAKYAATIVTHPDIIAATPANAAAVTDVQLVTAVREIWNGLSAVGGGPL
jgi:hypothetical protein